MVVSQVKYDFPEKPRHKMQLKRTSICQQCGISLLLLAFELECPQKKR